MGLAVADGREVVVPPKPVREAFLTALDRFGIERTVNSLAPSLSASVTCLGRARGRGLRLSSPTSSARARHLLPSAVRVASRRYAAV